MQVPRSGVTPQGPTVTIAGGAINIEAQNNVALNARSNLTVRVGSDLSVSAGSNTSVQAGGNLILRSGAGTVLHASGPLDLKGSTILWNGGTKTLATVGSLVQVPGLPGGQIMTGSSTVPGN